ncbi:MAG: N-acetyltransferase [Beijerinckiaceae bacterium]|nr:MAG: N-acetyltransferase [Beijerinckiaceae bacterium]
MPGIDLSAWTPRPSPAPVVLEGRYARLEPLDPARHADGLFAALMGEGSANDHLYLFETTMSRADFQVWIEAKAKRTDIQCHIVIDRQTGRIGGRQDFMRIDNAHGVIEIGSIHWGPIIARSRVATEALYLAAKHVFDDLGYRRFEWKCNNENLPSKRAAERFGFTYEGLFRQHMVAKGKNRDTAWFSMIDCEWPAIRAGFERWLDPANFDADGRQKRQLEQCRVGT